MFGLFKNRKLLSLDFARFQVDIHSHLIPAIDDGARDMDTALQMIKQLKDLGYRKLVTTPHIRWDMFRNTPDIIRSGLGQLQETLLLHNIEMELSAAAEYYLDDYFADFLKNRSPLLSFGDNRVLVEFSTLHQPFHLKELIFDILMAGYKPVIAHPERYTYLHNKFDLFQEFKSNGCGFQLNLLSLSGSYGKTVKEMAMSLIKADIYDFVGTDAHNPDHLKRLKVLTVNPEVQQYLYSAAIINSQLL